ncbi:cell division protein FtsA [Desulfitispora alkaliphila]|uniref:cell division protein FtsA n=1 Tax=Desulfitispora alkaliphila TaxID=622674 RepID=UPI003D24F0EA
MQLLAKRDIVVGIDIGSTKVVALVGEIKSEEAVSVIGFGECTSSGLRKGNIVDIDNVAKAIEEAVAKAEQMSGTEIEYAYVGITGSNIASLNNKGVVAVASGDNEISERDVDRVIQASKVISIPPDRKIIHVLPREFIVDGYNGIMDPVGMAGSRLEVEAHIVTGASTTIQNLLKTVERSGIKVAQLVLSSLASSQAVLLPAEKELGAVLVDIGGGTTEIAIYDQGSLCFTSVLPMGGDYITSDIAVGLRTPIANAEQIKKEAGCVLSELVSEADTIEVCGVSGRDTRVVSKKELAKIIEPRAQEILQIVKREIQRSGYKGLLPGGVVLTGGTALLDGMVEMTGEVLELPVRAGVPDQIGGVSDIVKNTAYSTGVGLLLYGSNNESCQRSDEKDSSFNHMFDKVKHWFRDFF